MNSQQHSVTRTIETGVAISPRLAAGTTWLVRATIRLSCGHITSHPLCEARHVLAISHLAWPTCSQPVIPDSTSLPSVRPRALIWWFRSRISVTHWIRAQGRSEIVRGPRGGSMYVSVEDGCWETSGRVWRTRLDVLVETETWIDTYHIPNSKNCNWVKFGRLYVLNQIQSWIRIELLGCKLVFNF